MLEDKIEYVVALVSEFAHRFNLTQVDAFNYIDRYKGIDFINRQYEVAHTLSFREMVEN